MLFLDSAASLLLHDWYNFLGIFNKAYSLYNNNIKLLEVHQMTWWHTGLALEMYAFNVFHSCTNTNLFIQDSERNLTFWDERLNVVIFVGSNKQWMLEFYKTYFVALG